MKIKFRKHRRLLDESMETAIDIKNKEDIAKYCSDELIRIDPDKLEINYYGFDSRIKWHAFIVAYPNYGVLGFIGFII